MSLKYNGAIIPLARKLRKEATPEEKHLWYDYLSTYEVRFQRQKVIDTFVADFYCHRARLIIEIDGSQHYTNNGMNKDAFRTERLEAYGLTIIRFTNIQIQKEFRAVCTYIDAVVKNSLSR